MIRRLTVYIIALASLLMLPSAAFAQLPSPSHGWNLGNTMEATSGAGTWGGLPSQALINSVAAAGFNTVRVPCAWNTNSTNGTINATYMSQVKQVVDWCYAKNLYVIINCHWDGGWFDGSSDGSNFDSYKSSINSQMQNLWTQVANTFKNYDNKLLFAAANEPPANTQARTNVLFQYYQNWVNYVRATGGNNATRWLIVQAPSTNIDYATSYVTAMPTDSAHHVMMEVHDYSPYQFTLMGSDQSWGSMFYFWGAAYHVTGSLANRNATWGEESYINAELDKCQAFVSRGIPVLVGEWRAEPKGTKSDLTGQYVTQNYNSCTYWDYYYHNAANARGIYVTCWDTPGQVFNWSTGAVTDQTQINALLGRSYVGSVFSGAPVANGTYRIVARHSGKALDAYGWGTANGTQIDQWTYGGGNNQRWTVTNLGNNVYTIINVNSGTSLDINGSGTANGTKVQLWTYGGGSNQKFTFTATDSGYFRITPQNATGSCLDVNGVSTADGALVQLYTYGGGNNQQWILQAP
jgi:aryl-phospho-beta-D-glucosidase BglC (GH1 family)